MTTVVAGAMTQAAADARYQAQWIIQEVTPTTGQTLNTSTPNGESLLVSLQHSVAIAALTIGMPSSPKLGQFFDFSSTGAVTLLTLTAPGMSIMNAPPQLAIGDYVSFRYTKANTWMRRI